MNLHSNDRHHKTTKLERIGMRAKSNKETVFNNLGHAVDMDLLRESYRQLDGKKAVGIDGVTKAAYGKRLEENLQSLLKRIRTGAYKPQPSKRVEIPKEDGSKRPLAISCLEDKIVQQSVATILSKVYEPIFLSCSYGYREGVNGHEALKALMKHSNRYDQGATVEIDLEKYFNTIPHLVLKDILREKILDKRFLKLLEKLIRAPILEEDEEAKLNTIGCPQGSIISPILSNIYLHHVIDSWFNEIRNSHFKGRAELIRFADDMVFVFQSQEDAKRFYEVLPKRLNKYGLQLHEDKSSVIASGSKAAEEAEKKEERLPSYRFLGFEVYWGKSRNGSWRLKFKSRRDRFTAKLKGLRSHLKERQNEETQTVLKRVIRVVRGWINYHAISDNKRRVKSFIYEVKRILFKWRNRKGGKRKLDWERFENLLKRTNFPISFKTKSMFASC